METKLDLKDHTIDAVQQLISVNIDSADVLGTAAKKVDHNAIETLFRGVAGARSSHAQELKNYVHMNDETPTEDGTATGSAHRYWVGFRAAVNSGDPKVMLIEAERAEDKIKGKYEDLLMETAGSAMNDVLMRQYREVKKHHDLIRDLRDAN